ncbi:hypothetical protein EJ02DRAFT_408020 [Clathrospora elynae]|uniref:Uncharacterized protein n=1 Tax=Clathrospora elynae TaxID=706981 RepID=A0A6A5SRG5_9PLEO|nr:hypothetical protein EJ02DRAFT_408020 [Clathrospora elynae]
MNWTGGSLQRTRKANQGVMQQQKAYFAKARTQLQNMQSSTVAPFRPSYLRDRDVDLFGQMPMLGSGSVRHTGHSARRRGETTRREHSPDDRQYETRYDEPSTRGEIHTNVPYRRPSATDTHKGKLHSVSQTDDVAEPNGEIRKANDTSAETQLLEANRKRLLSQQDWVAIDPSKPVNLRFLPSKEKEKIGKRRRTTGKHGAALRQKHDADLQGRPLHPVNDKFAVNFDNIRTRIGTNALTNTYLAQPKEYVQSQASSDPMLFDQEGTEAQQHAGKPEPVSPAKPPLRAANAPRQPSAPHARTLTGEEAEHYHDIASSNEPISSRAASEQVSLESVQLEPQPTRVTRQERESSAPGYRLTHRVQGNKRPLRLVFGDSTSSAGGRSRAVSGNRNIGGTKHAREAKSSGASQTGHMHHVNSDKKRSAIDEASATLAIIDEEPWRTYVALSDRDSCHSDTEFEPGNSMLHPCPTTQNNNEVVTNWSQHATYGGQTDIGSSLVSASLPSLKRGAQKHMPARLSGADSGRRGDPAATKPRVTNRDEELWEAFVIGSDNKLSSSQTRNSDAQGNRKMVSKDASGASSSYLPLSVAVSSVSDSLFRSASRFASYKSDGVQDAAGFAESLGSRAISPPIFRGFVEELSDGEADKTTEHSVFGEASVTQASLQNNASSDLISSRIFSATETSRSDLDRPGRRREVTGGQPRLDRKGAPSSSIYDIPVSEAETLDLVDRDKI